MLRAALDKLISVLPAWLQGQTRGIVHSTWDVVVETLRETTQLEVILSQIEEVYNASIESGEYTVNQKFLDINDSKVVEINLFPKDQNEADTMLNMIAAFKRKMWAEKFRGMRLYFNFYSATEELANHIHSNGVFFVHWDDIHKPAWLEDISSSKLRGDLKPEQIPANNARIYQYVWLRFPKQGQQYISFWLELDSESPVATKTGIETRMTKYS